MTAEHAGTSFENAITMIGGMHGDADDILRQRQLARHRRIGGDQLQGTGWSASIAPCLGQCLHGREPASSMAITA